MMAFLLDISLSNASGLFALADFCVSVSSLLTHSLSTFTSQGHFNRSLTPSQSVQEILCQVSEVKK